jgi:hypothetical protein
VAHAQSCFGDACQDLRLQGQATGCLFLSNIGGRAIEIGYRPADTIGLSQDFQQPGLTMSERVDLFELHQRWTQFRFTLVGPHLSITLVAPLGCMTKMSGDYAANYK